MRAKKNPIFFPCLVLPDDEAGSNTGAGTSWQVQVLWLGEDLAGTEGKQALRVHGRVVHWDGPQTSQETVCVSHASQVYHSTAVLHDAFAAVDLEAAWITSRVQMR